MKTIKASEFRATCLKVMDDVAETGEPVIVTKNGKPVAKFVPYREKVATFVGMAKDQIHFKKYIIETTESSDADQ